MAPTVVWMIIFIGIAIASTAAHEQECEGVMKVGPRSSSADDALSAAKCPAGYVGKSCQCAGTCDGSYFASNDTCHAFNSGSGELYAMAILECIEGRCVQSLDYLMTEEFVAGPKVSCAGAWKLLSCSVHTKWSFLYPSQVKYTISGNSCSAPTGCKRCRLQAVCMVMKATDNTPSPGIKEVGSSLSSISVEVAKPIQPHGTITKYTLEIWKEGTTEPRDMAAIKPTDPSHTFNNLKGHATYKVRARAWTSKGAGKWSQEISIITVERIPSSPNTITAGKSTINSVELIWTPPKYNNGVLKNYKVICIPTFSYDPAVNKDKSSYVITSAPSPDVRGTTITALQSATEYNCSVAAQTSKGYGPSVLIKIWTNPESVKIPDNLFLGIDKTSNTTITVDVKKMPKCLKAGLVSAVRIGVDKLVNSRRKRSTQLTRQEHTQIFDYQTAKEYGHRFYIAAELNASFSGVFIIGDGKTYGGYYNPPLETGQKYNVIFGIVLTAGMAKNTTYSRFENAVTVGGGTSSAVLAVGITFGCLLLLVVIIFPVVVVQRRKRNHNAEVSEMHTYESPIPMKETNAASSSDPTPSSLYAELGHAVQPEDAVQFYDKQDCHAEPIYENTREASRSTEGECGTPAAASPDGYYENDGMVVG